MQRRTTWLLAVAAVAVAVAVSAYLLRDPDVPIADSTTVVASADTPAASPAMAVPMISDSPRVSSATSPQSVARSIEDANSRDAGKRATAIAALATAPRA